MVAREVPRDERRVAAQPHPDEQGRGQRERPARRGGERRSAGPLRLAHAGLEARGQLGAGRLRSRARSARSASACARHAGHVSRCAATAAAACGSSSPSTKPVTRSGSQLNPSLPASASRSSARPRWMRDMTVPTGTPSAAAISA